MKKSIFLFLISILCVAFATAQNFYTVQIGTFVDAKMSDFEAIKPFGFVYAVKIDGNLTIIYLGGYDNRKAAEKAWEQARAKGYLNAFIVERRPTEGQQVAVVQIASRSALRPIDWETYAGINDLYVLLEGDALKIVQGVYTNADVARPAQEALRRAGFRDAFVKTVNTIFLHKVSDFETGIKKPLIPIVFEQTPPLAYEQPLSPPDITPRTPTVVNPPTTTSNPPLPARPVATPNLPRLRPNIKRRSVLELQKVLKAEGYYKGSLDGQYGESTARAYESMKTNNRELQKYQVLAQYLDLSSNTAATPLQKAIDNLPDDPTALRTLENSKAPVAKAYRAYVIYNTRGPGSEVNNLMNMAIREAFTGKKLSSTPPLDYRSTYAYNDLEQLLLHLHYVHSAPDSEASAPCWLLQRHPREMGRVFDRYANMASLNFPMRACDQFLTWEEIRLVVAIANDLSPNAKLSEQQQAQAASLRTLLYLSPKALPAADAKDLDTWHTNIWNGLNGWATRDPINQRMVVTFKAAFFQSQARLEDFYMDKNLSAEESKVLALATLRTLVGHQLQRFI